MIDVKQPCKHLNETKIPIAITGGVVETPLFVVYKFPSSTNFSFSC